MRKTEKEYSIDQDLKKIVYEKNAGHLGASGKDQRCQTNEGL